LIHFYKRNKKALKVKEVEVEELQDSDFSYLGAAT